MTGFNKYQSQIEDLGVDTRPAEVREQFHDFVANVPYVRNIVSPDRLRARDLPRDSGGRIIVDVTKPHALEGMDYFRPAAIAYQRTGRYTSLRPNPNPGSEFGKWIREERRRCLEGYVRESDGEWVTGDYYFFLNYCPIQQAKRDARGKAIRVIDFPRVWDGHYFKTHYLDQCRASGKHAAELSRRGSGKSYVAAAMLAKRFILGESAEVSRKVQCVATASERKYIQGANQLLDMFQYDIDFCADNTEWPSRRITSSLQNLQWTMGYVDVDTNTRRGTQNSVVGITSKDDESKLRGSRGVLYLIEEAGTFPRLLSLYSVLRPSVEDGDAVWGTIYLYGTSGDRESDFSSMQELMYNGEGYNILTMPNVYDKEGQGRARFTYFFPGYLNRDGCYDKDGNSDVTRALLQILDDRYRVKYNSTDVNAITKRVAEIPITPQEAILRSRSNVFPVTQLNERLNEIDNDPGFYDDVYVGVLEQDKDGKVRFRPTGDTPIRDFPTKDNKVMGAMEIYEMPQELRGEVPGGRYVASLDNYENDTANTMSLGSLLVLDLWTDRIVAEYTGRPAFADDLNEIARRTCMFYNCRLLYEAHPYYQLVRTPLGDKFWEDIKIGDTLFAPGGRIVTVTDIPMDGEDNIYEVSLADGRKVRASEGHLWSVYKVNCPEKTVNLTTRQMLDIGVRNKHGQHNFFIPDGGAVDYPHVEAPIDPYTLGLVLAKGTLSGLRQEVSRKSKRNFIPLSASVLDMEFYRDVIPYEIRHSGKGDTPSWSLYADDIGGKMRKLGLCGTRSESKFIPESYLRNDCETRLELLKGLMDGDGCAVRNGASVFITTSRKLKDDVLLLCRSLGIKAFENKGTEPHVAVSGDKEINCRKSYRIAIAANVPIFKLPRKREKQHVYKPGAKGSKASALLFKTPIESIRYVGRERCKCVTVNADDGLYLVGDYVVTHNCNKRNTFAYFSRMNALYMLEDTPEYLRQKQLVKTIGYGNSSKGVTATVPIKNHGFTLIRDWLLKPVTAVIDEEEVTVPNLHFIKGRALLKELMLFNPDINVDRVMSLVQLMIIRESRMVLCGGEPMARRGTPESYAGNDPFFERNYASRKHGPRDVLF